MKKKLDKSLIDAINFNHVMEHAVGEFRANLPPRPEPKPHDDLNWIKLSQRHEANLAYLQQIQFVEFGINQAKHLAAKMVKESRCELEMLAIDLGIALDEEDSQDE